MTTPALIAGRYNKTPNTSTNKDNIKKWLKHNNIPFEDNLNKKDLLLIVKKNPIEPSYYVDDIIKEFGHFPLRLPPYCCDGNPIELIWNTFKFNIRKNNFDVKCPEFVKLIFKTFDDITPSQWAASVRHTVKVFESFYWQKYNVPKIALINDHNYC